MATTTSELTAPLAWRLLDYWLIVYRRTWRGSVISSFLAPLLYVVAMGVVLGGFVEGDPARLEGATTYLAFVAPGLLAAQVMLTSFSEMTWPVMSCIKWDRNYHAMIASPLRVRDVVLAHLGFVLGRVAVVSAVFVLVLVPFGVFGTWWSPVAAFLVQLPLGLAFSGLVFTVTATTLSEAALGAMFRVVMMPLFLFSGAFFPVSNLGPVLEWFARVTPLWHGVDLTRMVTLGEVDVVMALVHLLYLGVLAATGVALAVRSLERRLLT